MNKEKIAVVVDSGCDVPHLQKRYDIRVIPFRILIGDRQYNDGHYAGGTATFSRVNCRKPAPSTEIVLRTLDEIKAEGYKRNIRRMHFEGLRDHRAIRFVSRNTATWIALCSTQEYFNRRHARHKGRNAD